MSNGRVQNSNKAKEERLPAGRQGMKEYWNAGLNNNLVFFHMIPSFHYSRIILKSYPTQNQTLLT